jgi:hypothetical protein
MLSNTFSCFPKSITDGKVIPIDTLDHVMYKDHKPTVTYYSPITGDIFSEDSLKLLIKHVEEKNYLSTDHKPFTFIANNIKIAYISLDNSLRATNAGFPLFKSVRLAKICEIVNKMDADIVLFSEAIRKSEDTTWLEMRRFISEQTGLEFCLESSNNFTPSCMSFGIACFAKSNILKDINYIQAHRLLEFEPDRGCFGSGCIVIELKDGTTLIGCHFPVDFKNEGENNNTVRAMISLIKLCDSFGDKIVYAFGDMNTIPGIINTSLNVVLSSSNWKLTNDRHTLYAAFFDETNANVLHATEIQQ